MKNAKYLQLWIILLLKANHQPDKFMWNGGILELKKGQFVTGRKQLSEDSGLKESTIEDILRYLENQQQIRQQKTTKYRVITIVNWEEYQISDTLSDNKATTKQQQSDTNNNDNKGNNSSADAPVGIRIESDMLENKKPKKRIDEHILEVFKCFGDKYPKIWEANKTQRVGAERLSERGVEQVKKAITFYRENKENEFCPDVSDPWKLENKWLALFEFKRKNNL